MPRVRNRCAGVVNGRWSPGLQPKASCPQRLPGCLEIQPNLLACLLWHGLLLRFCRLLGCSLRIPRLFSGRRVPGSRRQALLRIRHPDPTAGRTDLPQPKVAVRPSILQSPNAAHIITGDITKSRSTRQHLPLLLLPSQPLRIILLQLYSSTNPA